MSTARDFTGNIKPNFAFVRIKLLFIRNKRIGFHLICVAIAAITFLQACTKQDPEKTTGSPTPSLSTPAASVGQPQKLDLAAQPKKPAVKKCPRGMVRVPGGKVSVVFQGERWGGNFSQDVTIRPFCMDKYEASRPDATKNHPGKGEKPVPTGVKLELPAAQSKKGVLPWSGASYSWAEQACSMAGKRLPTLTEWQMAYSGPDPYPWPWGDQWQANTCWANELPMKLYPTGECCYKICSDNDCFMICDMVGGVSEWVLDNWDTKCYGGEQKMIAGGAAHLIRTMPSGQAPDPDKPGCWKFTGYSADRTALHHHDKNSYNIDDGFRCAVSLEE